ncbi:MAG: hypothetical protein QOH48_2218 [Actinomycetota bacterium]|jgi:uncharacterized protein (DUF1015 family)|nr:hypothetical protein [Actinomycetota bacterium]
MPDLNAFRGIRYSSTSGLAELVCPPFDVISDSEQRRLRALSPHNAIRLELAEKDADGGYGGVAETFDRWLRAGVLKQDPDGCLYIYRQDFTNGDGRRHRIAGVIGALGLEPFGRDSGVLPHERTMPGPKEDRLALMRACPVNFSPIYAIYRGSGQLGPYLDSLEHRPPAARFVGSEEILHRLWIINAPAEIAMLREAVRIGPLVIADGHHRYETALAFQQERSELANAGSIMCFCADADGEDLVVLPYHRVLRAATAASEVKRRATERYAARSVANEDAAASVEASSADHVFAIPLGDEALLVELADDDVAKELEGRAAAWRRLSVVVLHEIVLPQLFAEGIQEVAFVRDGSEVQRLVSRDGWTAGVLLQAVAPSQIVDVAASGERMPQKASYFWPKAITGLVFHSLQE